MRRKIVPRFPTWIIQAIVVTLAETGRAQTTQTADNTDNQSHSNYKQTFIIKFKCSDYQQTFKS